MPRITRASSSGAAVTPASLGLAQSVSAWKPAGAIAETFNRANGTPVNSAAVASGTLRVGGGMVIPANVALTSITVVSGTTALSVGSNQWFCLIRLSDRAVLCKTADDTSTAWGASTAKTLAITGGLTPTVDETVYVGVLQVATTPASQMGYAQSAVTAIAPMFGSTSTTGLTNPASLGATAAAVGGVQTPIYAYVS